MRLLAQRDNLWKVCVVDVSVDAEQTLKHVFDHCDKVFGEGHAYDNVRVKQKVPILEGKTVSSSSWDWTQVIK